MILKAGTLSDLQDARYCAAEGIPYLSFSLERGSFRKVAPGFITDVATWISGPVIVADYGVEDSAELILEECTKLKIKDIWYRKKYLLRIRNSLNMFASR
jgi:hypothetical protein